MAYYPLIYTCGILNVFGIPLASATWAALFAQSRHAGRQLVPIIVFMLVFGGVFVVQWAAMVNANPYPADITDKFAVLACLPDFMAPRQQRLLNADDVASVASQFAFPVVVKPVKCARNGLGVVVHDDDADAVVYLRREWAAVDGGESRERDYGVHV